MKTPLLACLKLTAALTTALLPWRAQAQAACDPRGAFDLNACHNAAPTEKVPPGRPASRGRPHPDPRCAERDKLDSTDWFACETGKPLETAQEKQARLARGKWTVDKKTDPMTDAAIYTARLPGVQRGGIGNGMELVVRCNKGDTELYISWGYVAHNLMQRTYFWFEETPQPVMLRVGKSAAKTAQWDVSTDKRGTFHPDPVPVLKQILADPTVLLAQATPYEQSPIIVHFNTLGIDLALAEQRQACKW